MEVLLFIGMLVLVVLVFDSRKTIKLLRDRIDGLEEQKLPAHVARPPQVRDPKEQETTTPEPIKRAAKAAAPPETANVKIAEPEPETPDQKTPQEPKADRPPAPSLAKRFEELIGGKLPIWIGGIALIFAGFFLVRFSIEAGLFGPAARCITAALFGLILIGLAEFGKNLPRIGRIFTDDLRIGHSIAGAGIAVLYATLYMASELYGLLGLIPALVGVIAVTILAFFLSQKHGPPTAIMGLIGGFAAPYVAGLGPESVAPLLIYLGIFTAGLFGLAIHRGWAWLALLATGGSVLWTTALLFMDAAGDTPLVGAFIVLLAIGGVITLSRTEPSFGLPKTLFRTIPLAAGLLQLIILAPLIEFSPIGWMFFTVLCIFAIILAWRDEEMTAAAAGALGLAIAMTAMAFSDIEADQPDLIPAVGFAVLFGVAGHAFALREKSGSLWALIGLAAPTGMLIIAATLAEFGWSDNFWGAACLIVALTAGLMAWRLRDKHGRILPLASLLTAIFLTIALYLWTPNSVAAVLTVAVAAGLAAWARITDNRIIALESGSFAGLAALFMAVSSIDILETLIASLSGETDLYTTLPPVLPLVSELLIPALAIIALAWFFRDSLGNRMAGLIGAIGLIAGGAFDYLLFKQPLAIGPTQQFVQFGFAERAVLTHLLALVGWFLLWRKWDIKLAASLRTIGFTLSGIALFRFVYFDLFLLSPTAVKQALGPAPLANLGTIHYMAAALWLWFFAKTAGIRDVGQRLVRMLDIGSLLAAIVAVIVTVRQAVHGTDIASPPYTSTETYLYSAGLLLLAIAWLVRGITITSALLRIAGLLLLTVITFKVFLVDAAQLDGVLRILSFLGLGIALIGIGWIYGKVMKSADAEPAEAS